MIRDISFALRSLVRTPVFTTVAVTMLSVGIGLTIFMFGAINMYALRPLPFPQPEQLVHFEYTDSRNTARNLAIPLLDWLQLRDDQQTLQGLAAYSVGTANLGGLDGAPERLSGAWLSADALSTLGVKPKLGRDLDVADTRAGAAPVALIGARVWQLRFNADPNIIGRHVRINGASTEIVGVLPEQFAFPVQESIWLPLSSDRRFAQSDEAPRVGSFGRLRDGTSIKQARADLDRLMTTMASERAEPLRGDQAKLEPLADEFILPQIRQANTTMFIAVLLVLLIACANVASLVLARFSARTRELGVRSALGASRGRLMLQVLTEVGAIALLATVLGWLGAEVISRLMDGMMSNTPAQLPYWVDKSADLRDVLFAAGIALVATLAAGLAPALRAGRIDPQTALRQGAGLGARGRLARVLVAGEVAVCMVLLVCGGIAIRSAIQAQQMPLGIQVDGVLTGRIALFESAYPDAAARLRFQQQLEPRLRALPGVEQVTFASTLPLMGYERQEYARVGDPVDRDSHLPQMWTSSVSDDFFSVFGIRLREGRLFDARDRVDSMPVAVVSASLAAAAWPGKSAIGQRVSTAPRDPDAPWLEVVGVVADSVQSDYLVTDATLAGHRGDGNVFRPIAQNPPAMTSFALRSSGDISSLNEAVRAAVTAVDADLPVYWLRPMREWRHVLLWGSDILANLFGVFAGFALLLAVAGIYAVLAFDVTRRTREIGVRRALGASAHSILKMVLRRGGLQVLTGLAIGTPLALLMSRALASMVMPGAPSDPRIYLGVGGVLVLAVILAATIPARRALCVDPMVALRDE